VVQGKGNPRARILFLGEAPGGEEDAAGICFVGRAGKILDEILKWASLHYTPLEYANIYIANPVRCRPVINSGGEFRNTTPQDIHLKTCKEYTNRLLEYMEPRLIICLGRTPTDFISEMVSQPAIHRARGKAFRWDKYVILPLYHPAHHVYHPSSLFETYEHIRSNWKLIIDALQDKKLMV